MSAVHRRILFPISPKIGGSDSPNLPPDVLQWAEMSEALRRTPLYDAHVAAGARIVPFAGWEMPVQYVGVVAEVKATREAVGLFDVSHMGRAYVVGEDAEAFFDRLTPNDVSKLSDSQGQYSLLCNPDGGIIDDIIVYRVRQTEFLVIFNAGNREKDLAWLRKNLAGFDATLADRSDETCLIAVQGPKAIELLGNDVARLSRFGLGSTNFAGIPITVARTGYTGEDGAELICNLADAEKLWNALVSAGAVPCGLGARDALRVEAGLSLYGHEMDESVNPYAARLGWVVKLDKATDFIGKEALTALKTSEQNRLVGVTLEGRGIPRENYPVLAPGTDTPCGTITSGTFSPTLQKGVAMARVPASLARLGTPLQVEIRGQRHDAQVAPLPFYKNV
jgi:aminomethyltransferase